MWLMIVCIGISWGGCALNDNVPYPDQASCEMALKTLVLSQPVNSEKSRSSAAYCRPKDAPAH